MNPIPQALIFEAATLKALQNLSWVKKELAAGKEVWQIFHLNVEAIARLYKYAYHLFQKQYYQKALHAFLFLTFLDRQQYDLWLGLGMSLQMCHHYEPAIDAYELAATCDIENPIAYFYLAKCLFAIHDHVTALDALDTAITYAEGQERYSELLQQATAAKESLLRRQ